MQLHTDPTIGSRPLRVTSDAFGANGSIPIEHTPLGADIAPPLAWGEVPPGTKSVAVLVEDPDAPRRIFVHWIVVGIPPSVTALPAGGELPEGAAHGLNDYGNAGWNGPNPPSGRHRYFFRIFALDINLEKAGLTKTDLMAAMKGHVLAQGELIGTFDKSGHAHGRTSRTAPVKQVR